MANPEDQKIGPALRPEDYERRDRAMEKLRGVTMGIAPTNLEEGFRLAEMLSKSTLVPKDFQGNPGNVLIAIQMGIEIGLAPMQALQSIAVINGRPSIWGDGLLALVVNSGLLEGQPEESFKDGVASCTVKRKGWPEKVTRSFSIDDAKKARLWTKQGPWQEYPERMLQMRARAFCLRDVFPDVLRGLAVAEEQRDVAPVAGGATIEVKADPDSQMHSELGCTDEEYRAVWLNWEALKTPPAQRMVQSKQFSGRAHDLLQELSGVVLRKLQDSAVVQPIPPKEISKSMKKRLAAVKKEAHVPVGIATQAMTPEAQAESLAKALDPPAQTGECCEHGVLITEPCDGCKALMAELDAEAAAQESTIKSAGTVASSGALPL